LWQKASDIVASLGPDPCKDLRPSLRFPAGLTNLGATCYANSILQCLYMNKSFREGVFSIEADVLKEQPVLYQLARLFALLRASNLAIVDSAPFIQTLELDNGVQQDSHEFLTLLFSLLERCLSCSKLPKARTVVQDLFRGGVSHVTKCSKCGNESEASSKIEDFYELELNVKGLNSLEESLDDYLSVEELRGDNQYYCECCATRVNATRSIKLRSLPAVLNFQLKRCVFLPNTTAKKKVTSAISFPGELDMRDRLFEHSQLELIYDLSAVLIHKGSAVSSGHYIAHVKDDNTNQWWEFDDEQVSNIGRHPFRGSSSSNSNSKPAQMDPVVADGTPNGKHIDVGKLQSSSYSSVSNVKTFSSSDAYMLMYILRRHGKAETEKKMKKDVVTECNVYLPSHLFEEVNQMNTSYVASCEEYKLKKESELSQITERQQEVRLVVSEAPVQSLEEPYFWIFTDWLRHWADNVTTFIIDNTPIQCLHGKVSVSKVGSMKRLSAKAWTILFSKYDGGPMLDKESYCFECLLEKAKSMVHADSYRDRRMLMRDVAEEVITGKKCLDGEALYYVSRTWLQQWIRRKNIDCPCEADAGPTASIRCPHGELLPDRALGARRLLIPENLWLFIYETATSVMPDDDGSSVFASDSQPCPLCSEELTEVACLEDHRREFKLKQRQSHEKLASGKSIALDARGKYYLLPSSWLSQWRTYITATGKNASSAEPDTLTSVIDLLKCDQHLKLLERPPDLVRKRGVILQKAPNTDGLTIISENDWKLFCEHWGGIEEKGISAEIELSNCSIEDASLASCEEMVVCEETLEADGEPDSKMPFIKTCPEVCENCIGEKESRELMKKLNYDNEDICVCFVHGKEPPRSVLEGSSNIMEPRRNSKRSRKTHFGNSVNLNVSASTSIYQLKMMIWESFGVIKENQMLHKGSRIIDEEAATLADMNIFPTDILWVTDSKIHENRDIADELSDQKMEVQQSEEGFRGSLLTSNI
jgi:ubiquitin carboxyl-terminal hydrolase 48